MGDISELITEWKY